MIVVDTSVWSRALRRRPAGQADAAATILRALIEAHEPVGLPGIVFQELLTGVRAPEQFERLLAALEPFPLLLAEREHHLLAAEIGNACRAAGVAASTPDLLIAATAVRLRGTLLTSDRDFVRIATCSSLKVRFVPDAVESTAE
jgi:predicted nucleic acid-binding protein